MTGTVESTWTATPVRSHSSIRRAGSQELSPISRKNRSPIIIRAQQGR
jgi:hypothetical protein